MIQLGDIYVADLNIEVRRRVLVVSSERFHRVSGRILIAPEVPGEAEDEINYPWRILVDHTVFALDLLRSLRATSLLDRVDRAPAQAMQAVRRALLAIT